MMLDPRRHAYRPDLADETLDGLIAAARFVAGEAALVTADRDPTLRVRARARQVELLHKPVKPASLRALLRMRGPGSGMAGRRLRA